MDIRDTRSLKTFAAERLSAAPEQKRILLIYTGITLALTALVTVITYCLNLQINQSVGLSQMHNRSMLSTIQTMLSIAQMIFLMCLDLGYLAAMLRVARGQYASPNSLRLGFDRFWPLLRCTLLQSLIYIGICIAGVYLGMILYLLSPLSASAMDILMPLTADAMAAGDGVLMVDDATYAQLISAMAPALILCSILICAAMIPISYRFRMANYVLIDRPAYGARAALRESRSMMKGNCLKLFKLDLSLWWYYAALIIASVVCYGDQILPMLGVELPWSETASYFIFYGLFLVIEFAIYYLLRNRVEVTYALAYDAIKPEEKNGNGVVLGNIFRM